MALQVSATKTEKVFKAVAKNVFLLRHEQYHVFFSRWFFMTLVLNVSGFCSTGPASYSLLRRKCRAELRLERRNNPPNRMDLEISAPDKKQV